MSGESLRSAGFTGVVDALEPSDNMYSIAEQKGIYSTRYSDMLSPDKVRYWISCTLWTVNSSHNNLYRIFKKFCNCCTRLELF